MEGAVEAHEGLGQIIDVALASLMAMPGVRRVGLALSEGGGRRLRFTASDRDNSRSVDWCHIDAYDDVPLTTVVRTGRPVFSAIDHLEKRYAHFVEFQRRRSNAAIAAVPLPGNASPMGGVIVYYDAAQSFDAGQRSALHDVAEELAAELRSAQAVTPRDVPALADMPVEPGSLVADLVVDGDPRAVGEIRRWARASLEDWGVDDELVDDVLVSLSELVTNAVIHAASTCEVRLLRDPGLLTVTVRDHGGAARAEADSPEDPLSVHGRGLQLVDALVSRWGSALDAVGTTVWFAVETSDGPTEQPEPRAFAAGSDRRRTRAPVWGSQRGLG